MVYGKRTKRRAWGDNLCAVLWVAALLSLAVGMAYGVMEAAGRRRAVPTMRQVVVEHGGTLWDLAERCRASGQDARKIAVEIRALNGLRMGEALQPGMRLVIPDYRTGPTELAQNSQPPG